MESNLEEEVLVETSVRGIRRLMEVFCMKFPNICKNNKFWKIIKDQNMLLKTGHHIFEVLRSTLSFIDPIVLSVFRDENLVHEVASHAHTMSLMTVTNHEAKILLLQEDCIPRLITLKKFNCCITNILDMLKIEGRNKNVVLIPFMYFDLSYIIVVNNKSYPIHELKPEELISDNNHPSILALIAKHIQIMVELLNYVTVLNVATRFPIPDCPHGCNFLTSDLTDEEIHQFLHQYFSVTYNESLIRYDSSRISPLTNKF